MTDSPSQVLVCVIASAGETHLSDAPTGSVWTQRNRGTFLWALRVSAVQRLMVRHLLAGSLRAARDKQEKQSPALCKLSHSVRSGIAEQPFLQNQNHLTLSILPVSA